MMENEMAEQPIFPMEGQALAARLLSTKLFAPPPRPALISRPRLLARLNQGLSSPLTLISAPAGSGKTSLVSEWRASAGKNVPLAWLSLDPEDNDPALFLAYLTAALETILPGLSASSLDMLRSPQPLPRQALLTDLINDLRESPHPFVLVLDDYHVITAEEVHRTLTYLLDHLPPPMHLMVLTREDPPFPLARLRARGQLVEVRAGDLRFTASEAAAFFQETMGLTLPPEKIAELEQRTEGWVAGLQLAALALQARRAVEAPSEPVGADFLRPFPSPESFSGSHPYVADYLSAEVLSRQPEEVRTFLLKTSILDRMTGDLCDRLVGSSDSQARLRQLDEANLFLVPLDEQRRWYRYHHLFAELLRSQLEETAPGELPGLHRRAAEWYEQHGLVSEAIKHALAARDMQRAAHVVERSAMARLMVGDSVTVLSWVNAVEPLLPERPWLGIFQSWALLVTGEIQPIEARLQAADSWTASQPASADAREMGFHIAAIRALIAGRRDEPERAIDLARQALHQLPEGESTIRSIVLLALGDASWATGDLAGAMRVFREASRTETAAGSIVPAAGALASVAGLLVEQGELRHAAETYQTVVRMSTRADGRVLPTAAHAYLGLAGLAYEWNDLDSAGRYAQKGQELARRWGNPVTIAGIYLVWAQLNHAQGQKVGAAELLRQAEELAQVPGVAPALACRIADFRVRLWLAQNNLEAAARWVEQQGLTPEDEITYPRQIAYLTLARVLAARGQADPALALLERLRAQLEARGQMGRVLELLVLQSLAHVKKGDIPGALAVLERALALGEPEGCMRVFIDEGEPMAELLRHAASRGIAPKYAAVLLSAFQPGDAAPSRQPLIEPLTDREVQVLRLIAGGLSNQAIADRLVVAVGTVKTHTASLYRKLDVTSRTQAVARATELGLL